MSGGVAGRDEFNRLVNELPVLLDRLVKSPLKERARLGSLPKKGMYVFYEAGRPIYVGRSNRMRERILEHSRPKSKHNSSTFAFILAKEEAEAKGFDTNMTRGDLEQDKAFKRIYTEQKARVSRMGIRTIELEDQKLQTLFEVCAAVVLETTKYNRFETH